MFSKLHAGKQTLPDLYSLDESVDSKNLKNTYDVGDTVPSRSWPSTRRNSPEMSSLWNAMDALDLTEPLIEYDYRSRLIYLRKNLSSDQDRVLNDDAVKDDDAKFTTGKGSMLSYTKFF